MQMKCTRQLYGAAKEEEEEGLCCLRDTGPKSFHTCQHTPNAHTHTQTVIQLHMLYPAAICLSAVANYGYYHAEAEIESVSERGRGREAAP